MTNLYNGYTRDEIAPIEFPFEIPGYGIIQTWKGWVNFIAHYKGMNESIDALQRAVAHLEIEKEMLQERIDSMLLLETELA